MEHAPVQTKEQAERKTRRGRKAAASVPSIPGIVALERIPLRLAYDSWAAPLLALRAHRLSLRYVRYEGERWGAADISIELTIKDEGAVRLARGQVRPVGQVYSGSAVQPGRERIEFEVAADGSFVIGELEPGLLTLELGPALIDDLLIE